MKKLVTAVVVLFSSLSFAKESSIESLKNSGFSLDISKEVEIVLPAAPQKDGVVNVGQDLEYRFKRVKDDLWRLNSDTTWLRNDINRLESEARRIANGASNSFFSNDLRRMSYDMSRYSNEIQRLSSEIKNLISLAQKDEKLNKIADDMQWDVRDLDSRFSFDIKNSAQSLEWTVKRIDPKIIGYNAQWDASDISRYARDISWKTSDMRWDAQKLADITKP